MPPGTRSIPVYEHHEATQASGQKMLRAVDRWVDFGTQVAQGDWVGASAARCPVTTLVVAQAPWHRNRRSRPVPRPRDRLQFQQCWGGSRHGGRLDQLVRGH